MTVNLSTLNSGDVVKGQYDTLFGGCELILVMLDDTNDVGGRRSTIIHVDGNAPMYLIGRDFWIQPWDRIELL